MPRFQHGEVPATPVKRWELVVGSEALPHHVGETTIAGKHQIHLPEEGLHELGWEQGDRLLVQIVRGDMLVLVRSPIRWADTVAGKLGDVFGDHEETSAYLNEERRSWRDE